MGGGPVEPFLSSAAAVAAPGDTIAKIHYRRSLDPRYAELDCLVPLDSAIYVSLLDPLNTPTFKPSPTKPIPAWMQLLPKQQTSSSNQVLKTRPRSILDAYFRPPSRFEFRSPSLSSRQQHTKKVQGSDNDRNINSDNKYEKVEMDMLCPRGRSRSRYISRFPTAVSPVPVPASSSQSQSQSHTQHVSRRRLQKSGKSTERNDLRTRRSLSPDPKFSHDSGSPGPYKQPAIIADEPLKRPSSRLTHSHSHSHSHSQSRSHTRSHSHSHPHTEVQNESQAPAPNGMRRFNCFSPDPDSESDEKERGEIEVASPGPALCTPGCKGKNVAWHSTVAGGSEGSAAAHTHTHTLAHAHSRTHTYSHSNPDCLTSPSNAQFDTDITPETKAQTSVTNAVKNVQHTGPGPGPGPGSGLSSESHTLNQSHLNPHPKPPPSPSHSQPQSRSQLQLHPHQRRPLPPKRQQSPLAAAWNRVMRPPRIPPGQSREFLDLYKSDTSTPASASAAAAVVGVRRGGLSLAMPGRERGREIGKGAAVEKG